MNAAEITDKLGLHSLRQRAWVRLHFCFPRVTATDSSPVYPIYLRHVRRRSVRGPRMVEQLAPQGWPPVSTQHTDIPARAPSPSSMSAVHPDTQRSLPIIPDYQLRTNPRLRNVCACRLFVFYCNADCGYRWARGRKHNAF